MTMTTPITLITGCSSGIGYELALALHRRGERVCATARRIASLAPLAEQGLLIRELDVVKPETFPALIADLAKEGFWVQTLINNAGYGAMGAVIDLTDRQLQQQFEVNLFAPIHLTRALVPQMIEHGDGLVVNISSVSGILPTPFAGAYCASKAALTAISDSLRMELAPLGVRVVTVQPGGIASGFGAAATDQVSLPNDSRYGPIADFIRTRANESQHVDATPASEFARELVSRLGADPEPVIRLGYRSSVLPWIKRLLPARILDAVLRRRYGLTVDRLRVRGLRG